MTRGLCSANPRMLRFRDPSYFQAGNLSNHLSEWEYVLSDYPKKDDISRYLCRGVDVTEFLVPFKGNFQGQRYNHDLPPSQFFANAKSCDQFTGFICTTIMERVSNGSLNIVGKVGLCKPPHLVMPITIEPSKPRMCHDERFLNCWTKDCPFTLDYLTDLIRYVDQDHFQSTFDDKSGYDHVRLHPPSHKYFGLEWQGWYFSYATLPFGWKASAYLYHSIGLAATSFIRSCGVPCAQYIDDRHIGQLRLPQDYKGESLTNSQLADMAAFIACSTLISLGYFIGLSKSCLKPVTVVRFLGYLCDSERQAFILPQDKRLKFAALREAILENKSVSLKNLQRFSGKTISFALLVPAAKLYTNATYQAIAKANKSSTTKIDLSEALRLEILHWRFLDSWDDCLPWRSEFHVQIQTFSDASNTGWGGFLLEKGKARSETRGYWDTQERELPITAKETLALLYSLKNLAEGHMNSKVDVFVDSKVLVACWERQLSKSAVIADALKGIFRFCAARGLDLSLRYIPSSENPADASSRVLSDLDAMLSETCWRRLDQTFGPHSIDLMAIPSNARRDHSGHRLPFFALFPCQESAGTNVFSQSLPPYENAYVFPPFVLVGPLLRYLLAQGCALTIIVPDLCPRKYWWPILERKAIASLLLGKKGDKSVLLFPAKKGPIAWSPRPLQWDLWAFRIMSSL